MVANIESTETTNIIIIIRQGLQNEDDSLATNATSPVRLSVPRSNFPVLMGNRSHRIDVPKLQNLKAMCSLLQSGQASESYHKRPIHRLSACLTSCVFEQIPLKHRVSKTRETLSQPPNKSLSNSVSDYPLTSHPLGCRSIL